jgi:hypothetical protein
MAALSSKLGAGVPTIGLLANKGRILAVGAVNLKVGRYNANLKRLSHEIDLAFEDMYG